MTKLSTLFTNLAVRAAFERAERDAGNTFAIPAKPAPTLPNSSAAQLVEA